MNMIFLEQKAAWESLTPWHKHISTLIVSGILDEQADTCLMWIEDNGFEIVSSSKEEGWTCFVMSQIQ
jgi:ribosomal protein L11 methylase PrmA